MSSLSNTEKMLLINKEQKNFYESKKGLTLTEKGNLLTQIWRKARRSQNELRKAINIDSDVYDLHKIWLADLSEKSVLDLGCYSGNQLSIEIAKKSKNYLGIDLSEPAIENLNEKIRAEKIENARGEAVDFLSEKFQQENKEKFDIIYAHSVMHHFRFFDDFLKKLSNCLKDGGVVISFDPMQTSLPMYLIRMLYRPFQSDREWEYPFKKSSFEKIEEHFNITDIQGVMGKTKFALPVYFINNKLGIRLAQKNYNKDKAGANKIGDDLWGCLLVTMRLRKK